MGNCQKVLESQRRDKDKTRSTMSVSNSLSVEQDQDLYSDVIPDERLAVVVLA